MARLDVSSIWGVAGPRRFQLSATSLNQVMGVDEPLIPRAWPAAWLSSFADNYCLQRKTSKSGSWHAQQSHHVNPLEIIILYRRAGIVP